MYCGACLWIVHTNLHNKNPLRPTEVLFATAWYCFSFFLVAVFFRFISLFHIGERECVYERMRERESEGNCACVSTIAAEARRLTIAKTCTQCVTECTRLACVHQTDHSKIEYCVQCCVAYGSLSHSLSLTLANNNTTLLWLAGSYSTHTLFVALYFATCTGADCISIESIDRFVADASAYFCCCCCCCLCCCKYVRNQFFLRELSHTLTLTLKSALFLFLVTVCYFACCLAFYVYMHAIQIATF